MFGWFKKKSQAVAAIATPVPVAVAAPIAAPLPQLAIPVEATLQDVALPVAPLPTPPAPIPVAVITPVARPALMIGAARSRRVDVVAEQAGGRRILAREPGTRQTYGFTRDAYGNYFLGSALDRSAVQLILDVPASLKAA